MTVPDNSTISIVGAGKLGRTVARLSLAAGFSVLVHGSGPLARTERILDTFARGATAVSMEMAAMADVVVLAIPLSDAEALDASLFDGALVVDPMNYWEEADGPRPDFTDPASPTSVMVQRWLPGATVVKALNHVAYKDLAAGARGASDRHRWGVAVAADNMEATAVVSEWVDAIGFDPVFIGALRATYILQPGQPLFGAAMLAAELRRRIA